MKAKEDKIREAWKKIGFDEPMTDNDGWKDYEYLPQNTDLSLFEIKNYKEPEFGFMTTLVRPKSLQGIENNNGCIKIEMLNKS